MKGSGRGVVGEGFKIKAGKSNRQKMEKGGLGETGDCAFLEGWGWGIVICVCSRAAKEMRDHCVRILECVRKWGGVCLEEAR